MLVRVRRAISRSRMLSHADGYDNHVRHTARPLVFWPLMFGPLAHGPMALMPLPFVQVFAIQGLHQQRSKVQPDLRPQHWGLVPRP